MRLPTPRVRGLARAGHGTVSARATGGSTAPRLGQFNEACLVLRLGQPVDPGRAALRPAPDHLHVTAIDHPVGTGNRVDRPLGDAGGGDAGPHPPAGFPRLALW
jgi:hypothetical protein